MTPAQAGFWLRFFQRRFTLLPDREELSRLWQELVETHSVTGFRAHDVEDVQPGPKGLPAGRLQVCRSTNQACSGVRHPRYPSNSVATAEPAGLIATIA